jgi:DinB superfamily
MELREWIKGEHDGLRTRFGQSVAAHVPVTRWREQAGSGGSSIAWLVLHTAWHEDLAMRAAVQGQAPLMTAWRPDLGLEKVAPTGGLGEAEQDDITAAVDLEALAACATAVHDATSAWLDDAELTTLDDVPGAGARIAGLADVTVDAVPWLHAMWDGKPTAWFVQWEAIGHRVNHLGEMVSVRNRLGLSPF